MKSISELQKFKSRKEWEEYVWRKLVEGISQAVSVKDVEQSLTLLLTAHEKKQIIKRAVAISLLKQGKSYSAIGKILWLSPQTISAIRKSMRGHNGYESRYMHNKKRQPKQKPMTQKELRQLLFSIKLQALFTLPPPPIPHPRLKRYL